jgi:hypothetical protein
VVDPCEVFRVLLRHAGEGYKITTQCVAPTAAVA